MTGILEVNNHALSNSPSFLLSASKMLLALILVLGVMFLLYYLSKKLLVKRSSMGGREKVIRVIANSYLGVKKQITLVEVAGEWLVLGITPNQISLLTRIERREPDSKEQPGYEINDRVRRPDPTQAGSAGSPDPGKRKFLCDDLETGLLSSEKSQVNQGFQTMLNQSLLNRGYLKQVSKAIEETVSQLERSG